MVPEGWGESTLGEVSRVTSGGTPSRKIGSYWGGTIPWVTTAEVDFNTITDTAEKITEEGLGNSSAKLFPEGTILMAMYGQGKTRGKVAKLGIDASTNQACAAMLLKHGCEVDYYFQYLISRYGYIRDLANSGGQDNLSAAIVKSIKVPVPPAEEQQKIAKILSTWDEAIATTEQLLANSEQQKKALMQQLLMGKKRLPGFEGQWQKLSLGELGEVSSAGVDKKSNPKEKTIRLLNYLDVFRREFIFDKELHHEVTAPDKKIEFCNVRKGDVFFTPSSETRDELAFSAVACEAMPGVVYSYHVVRLRPKVKLDVNFSAYLFQTPLFKRQAYKAGDGSGQRYVISQKSFRKMEVLVPPIAEQEAIGKVLRSASDKIQALRKEIDFLREEKKALMQQLLTGKRRVKIDEAERASA